jgi:hypothetical protein
VVKHEARAIGEHLIGKLFKNSVPSIASISKSTRTCWMKGAWGRRGCASTYLRRPRISDGVVVITVVEAHPIHSFTLHFLPPERGQVEEVVGAD